MKASLSLSLSRAAEKNRAPANQRASPLPPHGDVDQSDLDPLLSLSLSSLGSARDAKRERESEKKKRFQKPEHSIRLMGPQIRMFSFLSSLEH